MKNFEQFKKDFKRDVFIKVIINLKHGRVTKSSSKEVAKAVLDAFRLDQPRKVFEQINRITQDHPEILDAFIKRGNEYDTRHVNEQIPQILIYMKGGELN